MMLSPRWKIFLVLAAAVLLSRSARGQFPDCPAVSTEGGYKVIVDDVVGMPASLSEADFKIFMERLKGKINGNLQELAADLGSHPPNPVRCEKRQPHDGTFTLGLTTLLNERDVILEIWGAAGSDVDAKGRRFRRAHVSYALIPVRRYQSAVPGWPGIVDTDVESPPGQPAARDLELFDRARELKAYFAASVGVKSLNEGDYDEAKRLLCRAEGFLTEPPGPAAGSPEEALLERVRLLEDKTFQLARANASYKTGLTLVEAGRGRGTCSKR